jgi:pyrroloquinoline quinone biosynthesis protein E
LGGCRCQAFQLSGDAANADPVCSLSPHHDRVLEAVAAANRNASAGADVERPLVFRNVHNAKALTDSGDR